MEDVQSGIPVAGDKRFTFGGIIAGLYVVASILAQIMSDITFLYETHTYKGLSAGLLTQPSLRWLGEGLDVPLHAVASLYAGAAHALFGGLAFTVPDELSEFSLTTLVLVNLFAVVFLRFYGRPQRRGLLFWALAASIVCLSLFAADGLIYEGVSWVSIAFVLIFISNYILMLLVMRFGSVAVTAHPKVPAIFSTLTGAAICLIFLASTALIIASVWYSYWRAGLLQ